MLGLTTARFASNSVRCARALVQLEDCRLPDPPHRGSPFWVSQFWVPPFGSSLCGPPFTLLSFGLPFSPFSLFLFFFFLFFFFLFLFSFSFSFFFFLFVGCIETDFFQLQFRCDFFQHFARERVNFWSCLRRHPCCPQECGFHLMSAAM